MLPRWGRQSLHGPPSSQHPGQPSLWRPPLTFPTKLAFTVLTTPSELTLCSWRTSCFPGLSCFCAVSYICSSLLAAREKHIPTHYQPSTIEETGHVYIQRETHICISLQRYTYNRETESHTHQQKGQTKPWHRQGAPFAAFLPPPPLCRRYCLLRWLFRTHDSFPRDICQFHGGENENCGKESVLV